ncbi:MAG: hypothetical protein RLN69_15915, partial [Woeseiaceae bacterium]
MWMKAVITGISLALLLSNAVADEIVLDKAVHEWPEDITGSRVIDGPDNDGRWLFSGLFVPKFDPGNANFTSMYVSDGVNRKLREFSLSSDNLLSNDSSDPFRRFLELVLLERKDDSYKLLASDKLFVFRSLGAIPEDAISWTLEDGAVLFLGTEPVLPFIDKSLPQSTGTAHRTPNIDVIRLG